MRDFVLVLARSFDEPPVSTQSCVDTAARHAYTCASWKDHALLTACTQHRCYRCCLFPLHDSLKTSVDVSLYAVLERTWRGVPKVKAQGVHCLLPPAAHCGPHTGKTPACTRKGLVRASPLCSSTAATPLLQHHFEDRMIFNTTHTPPDQRADENLWANGHG